MKGPATSALTAIFSAAGSASFCRRVEVERRKVAGAEHYARGVASRPCVDGAIRKASGTFAKMFRRCIERGEDMGCNRLHQGRDLLVTRIARYPRQLSPQD